MFELEPLWRNFFDDGTVQFIHRIVAYLLFIYVIIVWRRSRQSGNDKVRFVFNVVLTATFFQAVLGIVTVMYSSPLERDFPSIWCDCFMGVDPMGEIRIGISTRTICTELDHDLTL